LTRTERFFQAVTARPRTVIALSLALMLTATACLPLLRKDTRADAFVPYDHPARVLSRQARETFGLGDPMVIAVINRDKDGVFNPDSLALVHWLSRELEQVPNIDPERITSLATENNITGVADGMSIAPFMTEPPATQAAADNIRRAVMDFPLHVGSLVAADGSGALIVAELLDQDRAQATYDALLQLVERAPGSSGDTVHVTGEGALAGYMGAYIDTDATRLNPVSALVILLLCLAAFRTLRGMLVPGLVILATVACTMGLMAVSGTPFYVITNALPVALIGIAVADSLHIMTEYYQVAARHPDWSGRELAVAAMTEAFRPISLTTITTMAGFLSLVVSAMMPPMRYFGLFALLGVGIAWIFTVTLLPALLTLLTPQPSGAYRALAGAPGDLRPDVFGRLLAPLGRFALRFPRTVIAMATALALAGVMGNDRILLNDSLIRTFQPQEPIVVADRTINQRFDGTYFLDVMVTTPTPEDLFQPENLRRIEALQAHLARHPLVADSVSIVDYLKQMHRAMNGDDPAAYRLPDDPELIAQYFLLYASTGDPRDFDHLIDYDYRLANLRVTLKSDYFVDLRQVIEYLDTYLAQEFNTDAISAQPTGRSYINYVWMQQLGPSQTNSTLLTLLLVLVMSAISFRSLAAGVFTLLPVAITVLGIYAYMGFAGLWLSVSTSMFAAIAIGLGIDFAIHTTERLRTLLASCSGDIDRAVAMLYPGTGRALLFNFLTLTLGFGVLAISKVKVLQEFGITVALAIALSFFASVLLLPALAKLLPPHRLGLAPRVNHSAKQPPRNSTR
jgi:hydrophobe/amphiphile efflux-3 (HAE3) family protein